MRVFAALGTTPAQLFDPHTTRTKVRPVFTEAEALLYARARLLETGEACGNACTLLAHAHQLTTRVAATNR